VVPRLGERLPDHRGHAEPSGRSPVLLTIDTLRVLAERALHADLLGEDDVERGAPPCLDGDRASTDRVTATRLDHYAGHPAEQCIVEPELVRIDAVHGTEPCAVGIGRLVGVVTGPTLAVLVHTEVRVGIDEAGKYPRPRGVDDTRVTRNLDVGVRPHLDDLAVGDQHGATVDGIACDGHHIATCNRLSHRGTL